MMRRGSRHRHGQSGTGIGTGTVRRAPAQTGGAQPGDVRRRHRPAGAGLLQVERLGVIRECLRDDLLTELGHLQSMRDSMSYLEFAGDRRSVDAASYAAAKVGKMAAMVAPNASGAQSFLDVGCQMTVGAQSEDAASNLWNLLGESSRLLETLLRLERTKTRHVLLRDFASSYKAAREAAKPERNADAGPNRYASLPCPAKDAAIAMLRDLSGELALHGVTAIALFGSVARGDDTPDSDLDIAAATVERDAFMVRARARRLIETHCGRHADVVPLPLHHPLDKTAACDLVVVA